MGDNIVICNENCSAGCNHCPYSMEYMVRDDALPESLYTINDIKSDFIILSGGEPFELDYDLLHKYTCMCLICKKYFRIATGGHIYIQPYLKLLKSNPFFLGIQIGTDVISEIRNLDSKKYKQTWVRNIECMKKDSVPYSVTITLSERFDLAEVLALIRIATPEFILVNFENRKKYENTFQLNMIRDFFSDCEIKYGYTHQSLHQ
ncbi:MULTISPECIES: hypothetical protein [unclassified Bartonella]|uniref:hypothetical protein n=2 Tax=Bartonella TaxID=773 RepID=UPI0035D1204E